MKKVSLVILCLFLFGFKVGDYVETTPRYAKKVDGKTHRGVITELDSTTYHQNIVATIHTNTGKMHISTYWLQKKEKFEELEEKRKELKY